MREYALTTIDNKSNPITEYDEWLRYDTDPCIGYYTESRIASLSNTSMGMSDNEYDSAVWQAMHELIKLEQDIGLTGTSGKPMYHIIVDADGNVLA